MMKTIYTLNAPKPIGPYAQAVVSNGLLFTSGQIALDPVTNDMAGEDIETQTRQVLANLAAVLDQAGSNPQKVVKTTIFLADLADFTVVNGLYGEFFGDHKPARSTVQVAALPKSARIEIELVAEI
ncbi:MAG: RidA family protein [Clostridia bacterium]|nr:RidA family protein [Clostridia bacterium]NCC76372.1 RidA family protein [Clostridia bacterium]